MDVSIEENRLILVGENGTGKSTFANLVYYFLTRQWNRFRDYRFQEITAVLDGIEFSLTPEKLENFFEHQHAAVVALRQFPPYLQGRFRRQIEEAPFPELIEDDQFVLSFSEEVHLHPRRVRELLHQYKNSVSDEAELQIMGKKIAGLFPDQFLYLPTYRRIEQDLKSIFRGLDIEDELEKFRRQLSRRATSHYVELVEFGMEDVEKTITKRLGQIKDSVRTGLDKLTGNYLREVIRGVYARVDVDKVRSIDANTLQSMFARIDDATLPKSDKDSLIRKVADMTGRSQIREEDRVIAHFLVMLIQFYIDQEASEKNVREFVRVSNEYLVGKELVYDSVEYTIYIRQSTEPGDQLKMNGDRLELKHLSSGEKQIVSLFSHIYLSGAQSFFVIIDEPELSLSVPWQRRFLPDIMNSGLCNGLVSVTHSPFVWENELGNSVRSLAEFTRPHHVLP